MKLFLIRHLPTDWNDNGILQGRQDIPIRDIDKKTEKEIQGIKKELNKVSIDVCFSSPLSRAVSTAKIYGFDSPIIDNRIIEFDFGKYEGLKKEQMLIEQGSVWLENVEKINMGESFKAFKTRIDEFIDDNKKNSNVLLFSHGFVIRYLIAKYRSKNLEEVNSIEVKNNKLYTIEVN